MKRGGFRRAAIGCEYIGKVQRNIQGLKFEVEVDMDNDWVWRLHNWAKSARRMFKVRWHSRDLIPFRIDNSRLFNGLDLEML